MGNELGAKMLSVAEAIRTKRAIRRFTEEPVPEEQIRAVLNAGRRSQSSKNTQPWHFIVVRDRETLQQLAQCGTYAGHLAGANFAVAIVASVSDRFDMGQAAAYMQLAAWELGIGSCIASIYEKEKAKAILGIPNELFFDTAISFGYPAAEQPPGAPGGRKSFDEVVKWEKWGD